MKEINLNFVIVQAAFLLGVVITLLVAMAKIVI